MRRRCEPRRSCGNAFRASTSHTGLEQRKPMRISGTNDAVREATTMQPRESVPAGAPPDLAPGLTAASPAFPAMPRAKRDCGDFDMRIDRNGVWHYRNSPIGRKELVCLFASVLKREPDGSYWLETPVERGRITVEDAPFVAVEMWWRDCV